MIRNYALHFITISQAGPSTRSCFQWQGIGPARTWRNAATGINCSCWFVLAAWFIVVQILMTICCCIEAINVVIVILIWLRTSKKDKSGHGERRPSICRVRTAMIIAITTSEWPYQWFLTSVSYLIAACNHQGNQCAIHDLYLVILSLCKIWLESMQQPIMNTCDVP